MSLKVDSAYQAECSMKAIHKGYGLCFASYLVRSFIIYMPVSYTHLTLPTKA